jgi:hypothetical protein
MTSRLRLVHARPALASRAVQLTDQAGAMWLAYGEYLGARLALIAATPDRRDAARAVCDAARSRFAVEAGTYVTQAKRYDDLI